MGVGCVALGLKELRLDGNLFLGRDDVPRLELLDHCPNVLLFCNQHSLLIADPRIAC